MLGADITEGNRHVLSHGADIGEQRQKINKSKDDMISHSDMYYKESKAGKWEGE